MQEKIIVAGIGTDVGKTLVSAVLTEKLKADYWKPVQAGDLDNSDTQKVRALVANSQSTFHPEAYRLNTPMSPHAAALIDQVEISLEEFELPATEGPLVVELAGGLMVPLNAEDLVIDLVEKLNLPVVVVANYYLGSINHTLLSVELLRQRGVEIKGIIFNGETVDSTKQIILSMTGLSLLGELPTLKKIDASVVSELGRNWSLE